MHAGLNELHEMSCVHTPILPFIKKDRAERNGTVKSKERESCGWFRKRNVFGKTQRTFQSYKNNKSMFIFRILHSITCPPTDLEEGSRGWR
jgi:hypothetical protein